MLQEIKLHWIRASGSAFFAQAGLNVPVPCSLVCAYLKTTSVNSPFLSNSTSAGFFFFTVDNISFCIVKESLYEKKFCWNVNWRVRNFLGNQTRHNLALEGQLASFVVI